MARYELDPRHRDFLLSIVRTAIALGVLVGLGGLAWARFIGG